MKSAYELAMERFSDGDEPLKLTDDQKERLAEVERRYQAKIAEAKLASKDRLAAASRQDAEQIRADLAVELRSLEERRERDKNKIREES